MKGKLSILRNTSVETGDTVTVKMETWDAILAMDLSLEQYAKLMTGESVPENYPHRPRHWPEEK